MVNGAEFRLRKSADIVAVFGLYTRHLTKLSDIGCKCVRNSTNFREERDIKFHLKENSDVFTDMKLI